VRNLYFDVALGTEKSFDQHGFLAEYDVYTEEAFGVRAEGQLLAEEDGLRIYLEGIGGNGITSALKGAIKYENTTDSVKYISADGIVLDGIYVPLVGGVNEVLPGCIVYDDIVISDMDFELYGITSVSEIQLQFEISLFNTLDGGGGFADVLWYPVRLECRGDAATFEESDDVVFDENGVRIAYMHCDYDKTSVKWYFSVVNESDSGVTVSINDFAINGVPCVSYFDSGFMNNGNLGAGQKTISEILYVGKLKKGDTVSFTIYIYDFTEEQLLFAGTETIELTVE